uniref:Secreted protein n=1 Tax=Anopheles melas TaxID=34690 RepID=A0A182TRC1_9DIPT
MELRVVWCVVVALWLARLSPVLASGFGKCPNYPSMPKFNMTKVRTNGPNPSSSSTHLVGCRTLSRLVLACTFAGGVVGGEGCSGGKRKQGKTPRFCRNLPPEEKACIRLHCA